MVQIRALTKKREYLCF